MALRRQGSHSFFKALFLLFAFVIGGVVFAVLYNAAKTTTENRSKAAQTDRIVKRWEFQKDAEGWSSDVLKLSAASGYLQGAFPASPKADTKYAINVSNANTRLSQGNKYLKFRLAVGPTVKLDSGDPKVMGEQDLAQARFGNMKPADPIVPPKREPTIKKIPIPTNIRSTIAPKPKVEDFSMIVSYSPKTTTDLTPQTKPIVIKGRADGTLKEYSVLLPEIGTLDISNLRIEFLQVRGTQKLAVDYVRLSDTVQPITPSSSPTKSPTPSGGPSCTPAFLTYQEYSATCPGGFEGIYFQCSDSYTQTIKDGCYSGQVLENRARDICAARYICSGTPSIPTPTPYTPTPIVVSHTPRPAPSCSDPINFSTIAEAERTTVKVEGAWWLGVSADPHYTAADFDYSQKAVYLRFDKTIPGGIVRVNISNSYPSELCASYNWVRN